MATPLRESLTQTLNHPSDLSPPEIWSNFLSPKIILQAKFWMTFSLREFFLEVLLHTVDIWEICSS